MYLLYLDGSGSVRNPTERHFVLADVRGLERLAPIQIADLLAWAVWRRYEHGDTRYFDRVVSRFDAEGGVIHGLVHFKPPAEECLCPACLSRARRVRT